MVVEADLKHVDKPISMDELINFYETIKNYFEVGNNPEDYNSFKEFHLDKLPNLMVSEGQGIVFMPPNKPRYLRKARRITNEELNFLYEEGVKQYDEAISIINKNKEGSGLETTISLIDAMYILGGVLPQAFRNLYGDTSRVADTYQGSVGTLIGSLETGKRR